MIIKLCSSWKSILMSKVKSYLDIWLSDCLDCWHWILRIFLRKSRVITHKQNTHDHLKKIKSYKHEWFSEYCDSYKSKSDCATVTHCIVWSNVYNSTVGGWTHVINSTYTIYIYIRNCQVHHKHLMIWCTNQFQYSIIEAMTIFYWIPNETCLMWPHQWQSCCLNSWLMV